MLIDNAKKYIGFNEADESFKRFSNSTEWCADFVSYVVKETYEQKGLPVPADFGHHRCEILKQWAIQHNCFFDIRNSQDRSKAVVDNIKPGDIVIFREDEKSETGEVTKIVSHTGIVTKVNADGSFDTIEGNIPIDGNTDGVGTGHYSATNRYITGFIQLPH